MSKVQFFPETLNWETENKLKSYTKILKSQKPKRMPLKKKKLVTLLYVSSTVIT